MGRVIAIDGPSGAGKSTISRMLAEMLGFEFLDTGALYRAAALHLRREGLDENSTDEDIKDTLNKISVIFKNGRVFLTPNSEIRTPDSGTTPPLIPVLVRRGECGDGEDVSEAIRTTEAGHYASVFSAKKAVREFLLQLQRDAAADREIVAEGRDMTTVVFPYAWKKFYLDASEEGRASRRYLQLREKGIDITLEGALEDVKERDQRDMKREISPLIKAEDAVIIDTTDKSIDEVLNCLMDACR